MTADVPFDHMVVFAPANDAQLCVEPVTNTTDCFSAAGMQEPVGGCVCCSRARRSPRRWNGRREEASSIHSQPRHIRQVI